MNETLQSNGIPDDYVTDLVALHADYYAPHWGFTNLFLDRVHAEATAFVRRFTPRRDLVARVNIDGKLAASITIDACATANGLAHLRWFITADSLRGQGYGNRLMATAVRFCRDKQYTGVFLNTFAGLDPARHLYEKFGFVLTDSKPGASWGTQVLEQRFELIFNDSTGSECDPRREGAVGARSGK